MDDRYDKIDGDVGIRVHGGFYEKLANFWYHYKWHTIGLLFTLFVIVVCVAQCAGNTRYDVQVLYAGNHAFGRVSEDGGFSEYSTAVSSLAELVEDYDRNGEVNVSFLDLYLLTAEEIAEIESGPDAGRLSYQLLQENSTMLKSNLDMSDYYVCFLSERLFVQYSEGDSNLGRFAKIAPYTAEGKEYDFVSEYGIRLSSLDIKNMPGLSSLDAEDTVVCIRNVSAASTMFGKETSAEQFQRGEELLRRILSYTK